MDTALIAFGTVWLASGVIGAGFLNAYFQRSYPMLGLQRFDFATSMATILFGPLGLIATVVCGYCTMGWSLRYRVPLRRPART